MSISIAELIDRLGGADAAATLTGVTPDAIRKWRGSGAIPSRHWPAIMTATGLSMEDLPRSPLESDTPPGATAALVLGDGSVFWGRGLGAHGISKPAELCCSTGMTGSTSHSPPERIVVPLGPNPETKPPAPHLKLVPQDPEKDF